MKIGILTLPLTNNYGGILQCYALKKVLNDNGLETVLIDYKNNPMSTVETIKRIIKNKLKGFFFSNSNKQIAFIDSSIKEVSVNAQTFIDVELSPKTKEIYTFDELFQTNRLVDGYIVGSDQVWRSDYTPNIKRYFLDFVEDSKLKISYAASFGKDSFNVDEDTYDYCIEQLKTFNSVSVREDSAKDILSNRFNVDSEHVLDPTMLLDANDYKELVNKYLPASKENESNIFCYILDRNELSNKLISFVSNTLNIKPFEVKPKNMDVNFEKSKKDYIFPHITLWLKAFIESEFIIIDSFHGCVFSIIFNKKFIAIGNVSRGLSRFNSLLSMFNLEGRMILNETDISKKLIHDEINWPLVNKLLKENKMKSKAFLFHQLKRSHIQ
jgi:hypothetical protein